MRLGSRFVKLVAFVLVAAINSVIADDITIYTDGALASGWENWSWNTELNFAATDIFAGSSGSSISVTSTEWAALSLYHRPSTFQGYAGLRFDIAGDQPDIQILIQSTADNAQGPAIPLSAISTSIKPNEFTSVLIDFSNLPGSGTALPDGTWDRITIQAAGSGASYHIDNLVLVESIVIQPEFLSAEPLASNVVAVTTKGAVDLSTVKVFLNGSPVTIKGQSSYVPVDTPSKSITYFDLGSNLAPGNLVINAGQASYNYTLPAVLYGSIVQTVTKPINPHIYGVNFPTSASYIQKLGVTLSRWGGNAVTAYNPDGHFTNAGNDWYFENRGSESADDWLAWVKGAGSDTLLTVPALDWVSKDDSSYSFPKTIYPDQQKYDPFKPDAGNGLWPNGTEISSPTPDPTLAYTAWTTDRAKTWLQGLKNKPKIVAIDNEIEIASSTHRDMHPKPVGYDEELKRVVDFAKASKEALPDVLVAAPSTCAWWFYWTSAIGWDDTKAHYNIDFLPWFLAEMKKASTASGKRLLDYLDIHYYFQADTSANDDAAKALRLRATRSFWDKSYVDESWVGTSEPQNHQWDPTSIQLIPRVRTLIDINYPGTKLSISEWASDNDLTGGLVTADALGIFGKYGVDAATYWATPDELGPTGLAYWLFRGFGTYFGSSTAQVNLANPDPNTWSIYAGTENKKLTLVIINKKTDKPVSFDLSNVPTGTYFMRHFGGGAGIAKWQATISLKTSQFIVVPPYTAVFLKQQ